MLRPKRHIHSFSALKKPPEAHYLVLMSNAFEFCLPTNRNKVPAGPEWFHEIKQDGFRIRVERDATACG